MSESRDPAIKLFGKTIPVPENPPGGRTSSANITVTSSSSSSSCGDGGGGNNRINDDIALDQDPPSCARTNGEEGEALQDSPIEKATEGKGENYVAFSTEDDSSKPDATSGKNESLEAPSAEKECSSSKSTKTGDEESDKNNSQEKTLKKPDKILPCPRCNSMDTKFCYYNNYNVNQPRHFCKNCQRYWTAGGTMRNVPVGAGRRKNKSSASHYRQISVPEALQNVRTDVPNGVHPSLKTDGTVLTFGSDMPLHESMASVLNLTDKTLRNGTTNGFHHLQPLAIPVSYEGGKSGMDHSEPTLKDETGKSESQEAVMKNYNGFPPQLQCFPGAPWAYPWNSAQWRSPVPPGLCPPAFAMPIFPAATYWGCTLPGPWNIPWIVSPSSPKQGTPSSGPNSPTLGKHSRDESMLAPSDSREGEPLKENSTERCLWIPKTLRIDDPEEAAKSSIWTTLGIRNEKPDSIGSHGLFKPFEVKSDNKHQTNGTCPVLQANPAALSRSVKFHESS